MFINPRTIFLSLIGLSNLVAAQVGYASMNGGIPISGPTTTVSSCAQLKTAVAVSSPMVVKIMGTISGCGVVDVASNKFIVGTGASTVMAESGFRIKNQSKVIIRNIKFKPPPPEQDAITIQASANVWVDHCVFESDLDHDKDYYDGLIDITHGSDWITISWSKFLNHWKGSLVGHSDSNAAEDTGKLHVTYHHNYWDNINSRLPSYRFGTGHVYSSCYYNVGESGISVRMGAVVRIENCYFENAPDCITTNLGSGSVQLNGNIFGPDATTSIDQYGVVTLPYSYTLTSANQVCALVKANAGVGIVTTLP